MRRILKILGDHIPNASQYQKWTLPSKLAFIGAIFGFVGVLLSVVLHLISADGLLGESTEEKALREFKTRIEQPLIEDCERLDAAFEGMMKFWYSNAKFHRNDLVGLRKQLYLDILDSSRLFASDPAVGVLYKSVGQINIDDLVSKARRDGSVSSRFVYRYLHHMDCICSVAGNHFGFGDRYYEIWNKDSKRYYEVVWKSRDGPYIDRKRLNECTPLSLP